MRFWFRSVLFLFLLSHGVPAQNNCINFDFEASSPSETSTSSVSGWTLSNNNTYVLCNPSSSSWTVGSNHFYLVSTPIFSVPVLGSLGHSPLGGTVVAQIGDISGTSKANRLSRTINVTSSNTVFTYAFAAAMIYHTAYNCCDGPGFRVLVRDCTGNLLNCVSNTLNAVCNTTQHYTNTVSSTSGTLYTNWQVKQIDLSAHLNSCVTVEVIANDCTWGGHYAVGYFDAVCGEASVPPPGASYCPNGGSAVLQAPPGYSAYVWSNSSGSLSANPALSSYTVSSPSPGQTFTAHLTTYAGCTSTMGFVIDTSYVNIVAIGASPSCPFGSSGTASVIPAGSGSGYSYVWTNATSSVVGTTSLVQNLSPGIYSVQVLAQNNSSCGIAGATVQVGNNQSEKYYAAKPFCGNTAYLSANGGSNFQWYIGNSAVTGSTGTSPSLTVNSPTNGDIVKLEYISAQGCHDTIIYTLWKTQALPTVTAQFNGLTCEGATNAQATINLIPSSGGLNNGNNYFSIFSTGTTTTFSTSVGALPQTTYTISGLHAGGTYSVVSFDGSCFASTSFSVPTFYTTGLFYLFPDDTISLCSGDNVNAFVAVTSLPPSYFTYSWSPLNFVTGTGTAPGILITPTVSTGNSATFNYSIVVTPTFVNCPSTKTMQLIVTNPPVPAISPVAAICDNDKGITASGIPGGGYYSGGGFIDSTGNINPQLANPGVNTFSYTTNTNGCILTTTTSFIVLQAPQVHLAGTDTLCFGSTGLLTASGASVYQWGNGSSAGTLTINPTSNTLYTVTGFANGCSDSDTIAVAVIPVPSVTINGNSPVCSGEKLVLHSSGAPNLKWISGPNSASYTVYPNSGTSYTAVGTDHLLFCSDTAVFTVVVNPKPVISVKAPDTLCLGEMVLLQASGAQNYIWNNQAAGSTFTNMVYSTKVYTVSGTNSFGCTSTASHTVHAVLCAGLAESSRTTGVKVYPNPAGDLVTISLTEAAFIKIVDSCGRTVLQGNYQAGVSPIAIADLAEGIYSLQVFNTTGNLSVRLLKLAAF